MFKNLSCESLGISPGASETIELALSNGFKGLELDLPEFGRLVETKGMAASRRLLDSSKLKVAEFRLPVDWDKDDAGFKQDLDKLAALARLAKELNCTRAVTHVLPASDERPYHQNFEVYRRRLVETAAVLEPLGIRLGVGFLASRKHRDDKNFQFIAQLDQLLMLLGLVGKPSVGLLLDLWDCHVGGAGSDSLRKLPIKQIVSVRLADIAPDVELDSAQEEQRTLPGEFGTIDSASLLTMLAEGSYDGPVTPYPHSSQFAGAKRDQVAKQAGATLDTVWKSAGLSAAGKLSAVVGK